MSCIATKSDATHTCLLPASKVFIIIILAIVIPKVASISLIFVAIVAAAVVAVNFAMLFCDGVEKLAFVKEYEY